MPLALLILCVQLLLHATMVDALFFGGLGSLGGCSCPSQSPSSCDGGLPSLPSPCQIFSCPPQSMPQPSACGAPSYSGSYNALPPAQPPAFLPSYPPAPPAGFIQFNSPPATSHSSFPASAPAFNSQPMPLPPSGGGAYSTAQFMSAPQQVAPALQQPLALQMPAAPQIPSNSYASSAQNSIVQTSSHHSVPSPSFSINVQPVPFIQQHLENYAGDASSHTFTSGPDMNTDDVVDNQSGNNYAQTASMSYSHQASHQVVEENSQIGNSIEEQLIPRPQPSNSYHPPKTDYHNNADVQTAANNYVQAQQQASIEENHNPSSSQSQSLSNIPAPPPLPDRSDYEDIVAEENQPGTTTSAQYSAAGTTAIPSYAASSTPSAVIGQGGSQPDTQANDFYSRSSHANSVGNTNPSAATTAEEHSNVGDAETEESEEGGTAGQSNGNVVEEYSRKAFDVKSAAIDEQEDDVSRDDNLKDVSANSLNAKREDNETRVEDYDDESHTTKAEFEKTKESTMQSLSHLDFQKPKDASISKCNSVKLMNLMHDKMTSSPSISKQLIFTQAAKEFPGRSIDVICSRHSFSYIVVTSPIYCEHRKSPLTCFAFFQP